MNIGITQREDIKPLLGAIDALERSYFDYYTDFGTTLVPLPNTVVALPERLATLSIEALILSGGNDVSPALYAGDPSVATNTSAARDELERQLLNWAIETSTPVFCECRGLQFLNVFCGGSLAQGIPNHVAVDHEIELTESTVTSTLGTSSFLANSFHNNGIRPDAVPRSLITFAVSADGLVEGLSHKTAPIAGVMWHPERRSPDTHISRMLVQAFLQRELFWSVDKRG